MGEVATSVRRIVSAPAATLFGILTDTNRFDRISGVGATRYTYELLDPKDPTSRTRIGHARQTFIPLHFAEEGEYWSGTFLRGERRFRGGLSKFIRRGFLEVFCTADGAETTKLHVRVGMEPTWIGWLLVPYLLVLNAIILRRYLGSVIRLVQATAAAPRPAASEPPAIHARYALGAHPSERRATGPRTQARQAIDDRLEVFAAAPVPDALRRRVVELTREAPDEAVLQLHPLEAAARWGEDGRDTIRTFLYATRAGLFDLEWQVDCPTCRVGTEVVPRLDSLRGRIHCDECDVSFDIDFASHVHATFTINPAIRQVPRVVFCASSPFFRPHVHGYVFVERGATRDLEPLPQGDILVRARGGRSSLTIPRVTGGVSVALDASGFRIVDEPVADHVLRVTNQTEYPVRLMVERSGWESPRARGSLIMTIPGFVDMFGTDAPAAGLPIEIGRLAVLFTDLVGSVELYNRVGDARAFALVQEHWRDVMAVVAARRGAVVKTLGDGVFASFAELSDAAAAAVDIMEAAERLSKEHQIAFAIRAGCHEGSCFVVRANDRIDLFGSTVNLAARLSSVAGGQQVALLASSAVERIRSALEASGCEIECVTSTIKGMPGEFSLALATRPARPQQSGTVPKLVRRRTDPIGIPKLQK